MSRKIQKIQEIPMKGHFVRAGRSEKKNQTIVRNVLSPLSSKPLMVCTIDVSMKVQTMDRKQHSTLGSLHLRLSLWWHTPLLCLYQSIAKGFHVYFIDF